MATLNTKTLERIREGLKRFQPIVESAKIRDVNESDTVVLLTGILSDILGYDKYTEITTELSIRGTYCDLALKVDNKILLLLEAKSVGIELKEQHVKQAVDYAANKGIEWVVLTNAVTWKVFKIVFTKPIQNILVCDINFLNLSTKGTDDLEYFGLLSKEGVLKSSLEDYYTQKQATGRFLIGNLICEEPILNAIRKELKIIFPEIKVGIEEIKQVLVSEVLKRELLEGDDASEAKKKIAKALRKKEKAKNEKANGSASHTVNDLNDAESSISSL